MEPLPKLRTTFTRSRKEIATIQVFSLNQSKPELIRFLVYLPYPFNQ
jgi:hypothetical protein